MKQSDILITIKPVVEAFEKLGVSYYIGGSVASSAYGMARATIIHSELVSKPDEPVKLPTPTDWSETTF